MTTDAECERAAEKIERVAADSMRTSTAQAIAHLTTAAEQMRDGASLIRARKHFVRLADEMGKAALLTMERAQVALARWYVATDPQVVLAERRREHGGMGDDAQVWPDLWQSTVCAAMLCTVAHCPSQEHGLRCTCHCHQRGA